MRPYQKEGMDWLVSLYDRGMSGILADEMGLGKTLQTIALLSHLACARGIWGPHLIIVPTSTLINWEMEFKRWSPGFHILTYYGSANERKNKRIGWNKGNTFHVCITSYQLVVQDALIFRRKKWFYLILDEAHNIKNYQSQRWQTLLSFYSKRRLLLTGTPLQNSLMELWSLMHFLMPALFRSRDEFKYWFSNPLTQMVEGKESYNKTLVERLHTVIRPFILRRTKSEVESQMPKKYYHLITCELSKRQSELYEDYISRRATKDTINGGNFMSMMNILMQLRKICNHPDLFEGRSIYAPFAMDGIDYILPSLLHRFYYGNSIYNIYSKDNENNNNNSVIFPEDTNTFKYSLYNFNFIQYEDYSMIDQELINELSKPPIDFVNENITFISEKEMNEIDIIFQNPEILESYKREREGYKQDYINIKRKMLHINQYRLQLHIIYGRKLRERVKVLPSILQYKITYYDDPKDFNNKHINNTTSLQPLVLNYNQRFNLMFDIICRFVSTIVPVLPRHEITCIYHKYGNSNKNVKYNPKELYEIRSEMGYHFWRIRKTLCFPEKWLIQFDCGKLQALAVLLRKLQKEKHKCLIFTQMTHMLDILEYFMNLHSFSYLRLDGSTSIIDRQHKMDRFNSDPKVFCFILSTRSGGLGINLIGADTVIFYDSDWNPAMDAQAQDRAHRIGQTRDVHIYRLVTKQTIEENILKKANAKRQLNQISLEDGQFNMGQYFKNFSYRDVISLIPVNDKEQQQEEEEEEKAIVPKGESAKEVEVYNQIEFINALNAVEDEGDVAAIKGVQAEIETENSEFKETTTDEDAIYDEEEKRNWINSSNQEYEKLTQSLPKIQQYSLYFHEELDKHQVVNYENLLAHSQEMEEKENTWEEQQALEIELAEEEMMMKDSDVYSLQATQLKPYKDMERMYYNYQNKLKKEMKIKEFTGANWETCKDSNTGYYYYRNIYTSETQWEIPEVIKNREIFIYALQHKYNGLPYEVMKTIYSYLIPYKDQINLSETSEHWNRGYRNLSLTVQVIPEDSEDIIKDNNKNIRYYKSIEDCINNCYPGDKIMIHSGVYYIKNELIITKPLHICSKGSVIINLLSPITIDVSGGGVFLNGLRFLSQNKTFIGAIRINNGKCVMNNCTISHSSGKGSAIYIRNGCKVDFFKCKISFSPQCGIKIENGKVRIMYSRISDNGNYGIVCLRGYLILLHSFIYDNGNTGIRMYRSPIGHISNNEFNRNQHGSFTTTPQSLPFIYFNDNKYPPIDNSSTNYRICNELDVE